MRKFKLLALAFVIGTASLFAFSTNDIGGPEKEIRNQIITLLETPDFEIEQDMSVIIKFTFNSEGQIIVLCAGCKDKEIVDYIRKNLNQKKFATPGEINKIYRIPFTIKAV